jgi:hypothetical protein
MPELVQQANVVKVEEERRLNLAKREIPELERR